ncbi:ArsA family ATPase [Leptolyngbya sp. FACHB-711]|uniref:ArsA family ATPase n=1 Tax=Leptolyngbya sp. FACHB-711 TaxID=2692813 RepID=UPI001682D406|nr:ArsA family ATPase [Leptolyngbya sp. FACHB-711]MBD2023184.1 ArsA family ATPase [Leptolyngbya sp. FACHB-711]
MLHYFDSLRLVLVSGKGGVGKTTFSCGFARRWARQFPGERVLLLSTDPAHSLGDVLQTEVGDEPGIVEDLLNLRVRALDAEKLLQGFKEKYGSILELLVERGSFVQGEDLSPVWSLSWPGVDELMGILEIQRILREQEADRVVVDMAPTGHTLNLFSLMDFLDNLLSAMGLFQEKHRYIAQSFTGRCDDDEADRFLHEMQADLTAGRHLLQNPAVTGCAIVVIPELMSYLETQRFIQALQLLQMPIGGMIVNQISDDSAGNDLNGLQEQQALLEKFIDIANPYPVLAIPVQPQEPIGSAALDHLISQVKTPQSMAVPADLVGSIESPEKLSPGLSDFVAEGKRLILVGGKGGVGKTTISAAIGWAMAVRHPDRQIRVISIDPAHSLGDAFGTLLGHDPVLLAGNLTAQEVNAHRILDRFREEYLWELAEMMSGDTKADSLKIAYGPEAWRQIVSQALPGIDEMLSLLMVIEQLEQNQQDLIILDTAPTGHLLRFLEMPAALGDWLAWIFKLWIKYQDIAGHTELIGRLRHLRQRVMQAQKQLKNPAHTEFIGVVQAQSAIVAEAERLTQSLLQQGVCQRYIVHNRFEMGQSISAEFREQTIARLRPLSRGLRPSAQIEAAADLLF